MLGGLDPSSREPWHLVKPILGFNATLESGEKGTEMVFLNPPTLGIAYILAGGEHVPIAGEAYHTSDIQTPLPFVMVFSLFLRFFV
jgi:hypothetical protein